jgi:ribosome modulation factor
VLGPDFGVNGKSSKIMPYRTPDERLKKAILKGLAEPVRHSRTVSGRPVPVQ